MEGMGDQDFIPLGQMVIKRDVMEGMAAQVSILLGKSALKKGKSKRVVGGWARYDLLVMTNDI